MELFSCNIQKNSGNENPEKIPYISGDGKPKKVSYISGNGTYQSVPQEISYISVNGNPEKILVLLETELSYIPGNRTFIFIFREKIYSEP